MALIPSVLSSRRVGQIPSYYTSTSGFFMHQAGNTATALSLTSASTTISAILTYSSIVSGTWAVVHDKDLDSNVYYGMAETGSPKNLIRYVLPKGGGSITSTTINSYSGASSSVLGACYAPSVMWSSTPGYGAFIIGGFNQAVLHVLEFAENKTSILTTYTVPYTSEVYGTEVIPKVVSGFTNDYGVAYTRGSKQMSSWVVDMSARTWSNRVDNSYSGTPAGSINGSSMIYYPIGKPIFTGDADITQNRLAFTDTSTASYYVFTVTEGTNALNWAYLKTVTFTNGGNGLYAYSMSVNSYNSVS